MSKYNICSALVHATQNKIDSVKMILEAQAGVEVHAKSEDGRLIVTIEDEDRKQVGDRIMGFYEIDGVLSASMIYQFSDDDFNEQEIVELQSTEERMSA
ncbi:MAG: chaperone NapD [Gammaproteobacteria bacterium]|nr:chaperone NapD [Gammaproteobacteria bacterium]